MKNKLLRQIEKLYQKQHINNLLRRGIFRNNKRLRFVLSVIVGFISVTLIAIYLTGRVTSVANTQATSTIKAYTLPEKNTHTPYNTDTYTTSAANTYTFPDQDTYTPPATDTYTLAATNAYKTSWIGNSFGGGNKWVQIQVTDMYVAPDGTVYTNTDWDEAGREVGIYKNGDVIGKADDLHGWGRMGGDAIAVDQKYMYVGDRKSVV